jgi:hypothetical protein
MLFRTMWLIRPRTSPEGNSPGQGCAKRKLTAREGSLPLSPGGAVFHREEQADEQEKCNDQFGSHD